MENVEVKNIEKGKKNILYAYGYTHQNGIKTNSLCRGRPTKILKYSVSAVNSSSFLGNITSKIVNPDY